MRLDKHGDIISSPCGRYIIDIAIAEKADRAKMAIARRRTREKMMNTQTIDVTEARAKGLIR